MSPAGTQRQDEVNRHVYHSPGVYRYYLSRALTPAEKAVVARYESHIRGCDVLDVGVGAGRTAYHLSPMARRYEAIDYSPVMVAFVKEKMPGISVRQADFSDMSMFQDASFDFILGTDNVIDAISHDQRLKALSQSARVLRPGGVLAFSSHNLRYKRAMAAPWLDWSANPARLGKNCAKYALSWWNHLRVGKMRQTLGDHALLNDRGHLYAILHYYAPRSTVRAQLAANGLQCLESIEPGGRTVGEAEDDREYPNFMYVARLG